MMMDYEKLADLHEKLTKALDLAEGYDVELEMFLAKKINEIEFDLKRIKIHEKLTEVLNLVEGYDDELETLLTKKIDEIEFDLERYEGEEEIE